MPGMKVWMFSIELNLVSGELLSIQMSDTTTGLKMFDTFMKIMNEYNLSLNNIDSYATDSSTPA